MSTRSHSPRPDPLDERADARGHLRYHRCIWPDCPEFEDPNWLVNLCRDHALHVRNGMNTYDRGTLALQQRRRETVAAKQEATAAKIDAGERVTPGDLIPGWVYYIRIDDTIKIGYAKNVASRMRAYPPSATLLAVEPGTKKLERARHNHFHAYLAHGREWFRPSDELLTWIETLIAEYGKPTDHEYRYTTPQTSKQMTMPRGYRGVKKTAA